MELKKANNNGDGTETLDPSRERQMAIVARPCRLPVVALKEWKLNNDQLARRFWEDYLVLETKLHSDEHARFQQYNLELELQVLAGLRIAYVRATNNLESTRDITESFANARTDPSWSNLASLGAALFKSAASTRTLLNDPKSKMLQAAQTLYNYVLQGPPESEGQQVQEGQSFLGGGNFLNIESQYIDDLKAATDKATTKKTWKSLRRWAKAMDSAVEKNQSLITQNFNLNRSNYTRDLRCEWPVLIAFVI